MKENEQFFENELKQDFDKDIFNQNNVEEQKDIDVENLPTECKKTSLISKLVEKIINLFRR